MARRFVVAESASGRLLAFDHRGELRASLALAPGIGPMTFTPDGRHLFVANPAGNRVDVIDIAAWRHAHRVPVSGRPFDIAMTGAYAYVRSLDTEAVALVALASLAGNTPRVQHVAMGERAPARTPQLPIATQVVPMLDDTGSFVASPGDNAIYFYMEGMNAPAGSITARGQDLRAVRVSRRSLLEVAPGIFETQTKLPHAPRLVVAVATESPRTRLCTSFAVEHDAGAAQHAVLRWEQLPLRAGDAIRLRLDVAAGVELPERLWLRLAQQGGGVLGVWAPLLSRSAGSGVYAADAPALAHGTWSLHVQPPAATGMGATFMNFVRAGER